MFDRPVRWKRRGHTMRAVTQIHSRLPRPYSAAHRLYPQAQDDTLAYRWAYHGEVGRPMPHLGHSRPGRASSKPGHVRGALKAEVFQSICDNSTGYCGLMALPGPRLSLAQGMPCAPFRNLMRPD